MPSCHNLETSLVARDLSRLLSVKPNEWMHLSPFYTVFTGSGSGMQNPLANFIGVFSLVRDVRGFQVNPLCRHDIMSPFPPSGNGGYVRNLDDPCELANYRPISNLPFMSKILEKVVSAQLCSFLLKNYIYEEFQSGFRPAIAQKLHLLKLQMTCFLRQTKAASRC